MWKGVRLADNANHDSHTIYPCKQVRLCRYLFKSIQMIKTDFPQIDLRTLKIKDGLLSLHSTGMFADTIRYSLENGKSLREVCSMIQKQWVEDASDVEFVIGPDLLKLIRDVYGHAL